MSLDMNNGAKHFFSSFLVDFIVIIAAVSDLGNGICFAGAVVIPIFSRSDRYCVLICLTGPVICNFVSKTQKKVFFFRRRLVQGARNPPTVILYRLAHQRQQ